MRVIPALAVLATLSFGTPAALAEEGNAANGFKLSQERCARCHNIEKGGAFKQFPPSFQAISIYRNRMEIWGRILSPSPHTGMPGMMWVLTPEEVQDLLAYITSLDTPVSLQQ